MGSAVGPDNAKTYRAINTRGAIPLVATQGSLRPSATSAVNDRFRLARGGGLDNDAPNLPPSPRVSAAS